MSKQIPYSDSSSDTNKVTPISTPSPTLAPGTGTGAPTCSSSPAESLNWKGHTWRITNGAMAGIAPSSGNNIYVDSNGYLHLMINKNCSSSWAGAEIFSSDKMGFGTYLYQIQGSVDQLDKSTVLGIFPYGPAAGIGEDGENELDTEFARWDIDSAPNTDFAFYPSTGNGSVDSNGRAKAAGVDTFTTNLSGGNLLTVQMTWTSTRVVGTIMSGLQPINSSANILHTFSFSPSNPTANIPQVPLPLGINFWIFQEYPATSQEIIFRDFKYSPL